MAAAGIAWIGSAASGAPRRRTIRRWGGIALCAWALLGAAVGARAAAVTPDQEVHRFYGYAFDQTTGHYLYTEVHRHVYRDNHWIAGTIRYYAPDGTLIGDKTLDFSRDPFVPLFRLSLPGEGYQEGISAIGSGTIDVDKLRHGQHEHVRLDRAPAMVADSGFHPFVVQHLEELQRGQPVTLDYIAVGRMHDYRFRIVKVGDTTADGHPALQLRAEPDSLLRLLVPPLLMTYDLKTQYLTEYRGLSNLHDPATGKSLLVHLVYPSRPPEGAPANLPPLESADPSPAAAAAASGSH